MKNRINAEHYIWGDACEGWRLLDDNDLAIIEERMPPGTAEVRHKHRQANQVFYVLSGTLTLEVNGVVEHLSAFDSMNVRPELPHQARNEGEEDARFLVISAPTTRGDRTPS